MGGDERSPPFLFARLSQYDAAMRHRDAVAMFAGAPLERPAPSRWADLGAGDGTFTVALADRLAPGSTIHAVDRDAAALARIAASKNGVAIETHVADFTRSLPVPSSLDGIVMANALHFVRDKPAFLKTCAARLNSGGRFLIVEYDTDTANPWVPYPVSLSSLPGLLAAIGFSKVESLGTRRSFYQRARLYAALVSRGA